MGHSIKFRYPRMPTLKSSQLRAFRLAFCLAVFSSVVTNPQNDSSLATRIEKALKAKEPDWRYVGAIESGRVPLVPSERRIITGTWSARSRVRKTLTFLCTASRAVRRRQHGYDQFAISELRRAGKLMSFKLVMRDICRSIRMETDSILRFAEGQSSRN